MARLAGGSQTMQVQAGGRKGPRRAQGPLPPQVGKVGRTGPLTGWVPYFIRTWEGPTLFLEFNRLLCLWLGNLMGFQRERGLESNRLLGPSKGSVFPVKRGDSSCSPTPTPRLR